MVDPLKFLKKELKVDEKHTHSMMRVKSDSKKVKYMCIGPTCGYIRPREQLFNKLNSCIYCGSHHLLTAADLSKVKPHCGCRNKIKVDLLKMERDLFVLKLGAK